MGKVQGGFWSGGKVEFSPSETQFQKKKLWKKRKKENVLMRSVGLVGHRGRESYDGYQWIM